jgi:hypothetical protein
MVFVWPLVLFYVGMGIQMFIACQFFRYPVENLSDMFEPAQFEQVITILDLAMEANLTIGQVNYTGTALDPSNYTSSTYTRVHKWTQQACMEQNLPQVYMDVIIFFSIIYLFGKFMTEISSFSEQVQCLFRLDHGVAQDEVDEEDERAITLAAAVPAANAEISVISLRALYFSVVTILLPQLVFNLLVCYIGAKYFCVQQSIMRLLRSALKVYFIIKFDGFLFKAFTADNFKKLVKGATFKVLHSEDAKPAHGWWQTVGKILVQFVVAVVLALIAQRVMFEPSRTLGYKCDEYREFFGMNGYPSNARNYKRTVSCLMGIPDESCSMDPFSPFST